MNPALAAIALVTIGGGVLAVSARDARATVLGVLIVLLDAPLIATPWPDPLSILARIAATLLAVRLISIGLRGELIVAGSRIGWPAEALLAVAAAVVGYGSHGLGAAGLGAAEAQATGFALVVLAAAPLLVGRDAVRLAIGALLLLVAATLIRVGLGPRPTEAEQLVTALLTIALGGAIAVIVLAARAAGGLDAIDAIDGDAQRRPPDAHRPSERTPRRPRAATRRPAAGPRVRQPRSQPGGEPGAEPGGEPGSGSGRGRDA
ncbi:MAG TPA: hypothetical protein VGJ71_04785 [Candidatus Limnocylindrales bacterium]